MAVTFHFDFREAYVAQPLRDRLVRCPLLEAGEPHGRMIASALADRKCAECSGVGEHLRPGVGLRRRVDLGGCRLDVRREFAGSVRVERTDLFIVRQWRLTPCLTFGNSLHEWNDERAILEHLVSQRLSGIVPRNS